MENNKLENSVECVASSSKSRPKRKTSFHDEDNLREVKIAKSSEDSAVKDEAYNSDSFQENDKTNSKQVEEKKNLKRKRSAEDEEKAEKIEESEEEMEKAGECEAEVIVATSEVTKEESDEEDKPAVKRRKLEDSEEKIKRFTKNLCVCNEKIAAEEKVDKKEKGTAIITVEKWRLHKVQSPIELKHEESSEYDHFEPLEFHGHWDDIGSAALVNNGFTCVLTFKDRKQPLLKGGPLLGDNFVFEQLHFHWSDDDNSGCEHIFEGRAYSMEAHAVHYNKKYGSFKKAVEKPDGLAVVAFFLEATENSENELFEKMYEGVKKIEKVNAETSIPPDCLLWFKEHAHCKGYYTYQGSLTTEPFFESVTWIIYPTPISISRSQVSLFRKLKSTPCEKKTIIKNVRPIQIPDKKLDIYYARSHRRS